LVGVIVAGFGENGIEWSVAGGYADVPTLEPLLANRRMMAGSITKVVTAVAVLQLVAEERIGLHDAVNAHLRSLVVSSDDVTVHHLLCHSGGVASDFEHLVDEVRPMREMLGPVVEVQFPPGSKFEYSNGGYTVLGQMLADLEGEAYEDVVQRRVLTPLGMDSSSMALRWPDDVPTGHLVAEGGVETTDRVVPSVLPAGGLVSTAPDLARLACGWGTLLPPHLCDLAVAPHAVRPVGTQGYGWAISELDGVPTIGHGGGVRGFSSYLLLAKDGRCGVVLLTNTEGVRFDDVLYAGMRAALGNHPSPG
jgi:CubicO group peptidase (beta-lactamase class C family)